MSETNQAAYFGKLNATLRAQGRAIPQLLIDLEALDRNIDRLQQVIRPEAPLRLVAKSLPAPDLLDYIASRMQVRKLMVFHQPFLSQLAAAGKWDDLLLGKPLPVDAARYFYKQHKQSDFDPFAQVQWLIDTNERLEQYRQLAAELGRPLRINLEIDVGLHRGGFEDLTGLRAALEKIGQAGKANETSESNSGQLKLSGLMGYDPHVTKIPSFIKSTSAALGSANKFYRSCIGLIKADFPGLWSEELTLNGAGSPTISLHGQDSPLNDVAAGSCLLKPTAFDTPELTDFEPACFIATPVLKVFEGTTLPALEKMKGVFNLLRPSYRQSAFIYGGFWKADYYYPPGLGRNAIFGDSTNQTMVNALADTPLKVDDFIFLRPHQSEFVLLQFGAIQAYRNGQIEAQWAPFKN